MGADDVGTGEDRGYVGGGSGMEAVFHGGRGAVEQDSERRVLGEGVCEKAFAGGTGEDGQVKLAELVEVGEERVVFVEFLAEADAGVDDDFVAWDAGGNGGFDALGQGCKDEGKDFVGGERWQRGPVLRTASGVHEDCSAAECGAGGGHGGVPVVAADVVDDLGSGFNGVTCSVCVEGIDGEDGFGALLQDGLDDGEDAGLLFAGGERGGVRAGGFAADVENVGAFVEHGEGLREGSFGGVLGGVKVAAVGEGIGCDVEDAHDEGARAEGKGAGVEVPVVMAAGRKGHAGILCRE